MKELRFCRELYSGEAVDSAVKAFHGLAQFELREEKDHWVVVVSGAEEERVRELVGELANHILGLTIQDRCQ